MNEPRATRRRVVSLSLGKGPGDSVDAMFELPRPLCERCRIAHSGICYTSITRDDAKALTNLSIDIEQIQKEAWDYQRARAMRFMDGVVTASGRVRALAIASCGRVHAGVRDGKFVLVRKRCNDRACPPCAFRRATRIGEDLGKALQTRKAPLYAVVLTQRKPVNGTAHDAIAMVMDRWRQCVNKKTSAGRRFAERHAGALRGVECTWSDAGDIRKDGTRVPYPGFHAHIHVIVEGGTLADCGRFVDDWCALGDADYCAQHISVIRPGFERELAKYTVKGMEHVPDEKGAEMYRALHGKRLIEGCGEWKGWRKWITEETEKKPMFVSNETIGTLWRMKRNGTMSFMVANRKRETDMLDLRDFFESRPKLAGEPVERRKTSLITLANAGDAQT